MHEAANDPTDIEKFRRVIMLLARRLIDLGCNGAVKNQVLPILAGLFR
jgi:hypothetical protein